MRFFSACVIVLLCVLASCDRSECTNTNPVFDKYPSGAPQYNAELVRALAVADSTHLTWWIDRYMCINNRHYMEAYVQGGGLCAKMILEIGGVKRLDNFITIGGESYSGAEMTGMHYRVDTTGGKVSFVMTGLEHIID